MRFVRPQLERCGLIPYTAAGIFCCTSLTDAARASEIDTLVFGSLDAAAATFVTAGAKIGLQSLNRDGAIVLASVGGGRQNERGSDGADRRYTAIGAVVLGYQWVFEWGAVAAFMGPEVSAQMLTGRHEPASLHPQVGLRLQGEIWARPTEATLLQATLVAGTAVESLWTRAAWGYRLWGAYLGPELSYYTDASGYRKSSLGMHATDFDLGPVSVRIAVGVQTETGRRAAGPYMALSVWTPW